MVAINPHKSAKLELSSRLDFHVTNGPIGVPKIMDFNLVAEFVFVNAIVLHRTRRMSSAVAGIRYTFSKNENEKLYCNDVVSANFGTPSMNRFQAVPWPFSRHNVVGASKKRRFPETFANR